MGNKLYFECPNGMDEKILWEAGKSLVGWDEKQEALLEKRLGGKAGNRMLSFQEARVQILKWHLKEEIQKKMLLALECLGKETLSLEKEEEFYYLAGWSILLEQLGISQIQVNALREGTGALTAGGDSEKILQILEKSNLKIELLPEKGELLTIFSVAFLGAFGVSCPFSGAYFIEKRVVAGQEQPVCLLLLSRDREEKEEGERQDQVQVLETNVDDCSGEQLGYAIECLMNAGALDASCFPVYMKKHRPAYMLQVICKKEKQNQLEDIIFRETTSIGLRRYEEERRILPRRFREVCLQDGHKVKIKECEHHGQRYFYPEYETVKQVCLDTGRPYRSVYDEAAALAGGMYDKL